MDRHLSSRLQTLNLKKTLHYVNHDFRRDYRPPLHKGTKCDMRFKSSLNSARLNLLNPYK